MPFHSNSPSLFSNAKNHHEGISCYCAYAERKAKAHRLKSTIFFHQDNTGYWSREQALGSTRFFRQDPFRFETMPSYDASSRATLRTNPAHCQPAGFTRGRPTTWSVFVFIEPLDVQGACRRIRCVPLYGGDGLPLAGRQDTGDDLPEVRKVPPGELGENRDTVDLDLEACFTPDDARHGGFGYFAQDLLPQGLKARAVPSSATVFNVNGDRDRACHPDVGRTCGSNSSGYAFFPSVVATAK